MGRAYFATRISENISKTPEGYLLCLNVPIGRTGWYDYLGHELVSDGSLEANKSYKVFRSEYEVFSPASLASFEGKSACDGHPVEWLDANNDSAYSKGHAQNVRRGEGEENQASIADIIIKDAVLINKIENGLREVSCGYNMDYVPQSDGTFLQVNIRGNHIAIVPSGRAGERIAIKDELPKKIKEGVQPMKFINKILAAGFQAWAKDAKPEEVAEAMKEMSKSKDDHDDDSELKKEGKDEEKVDPLKGITDAITRINARLESLEKGEAAEEPSALDALEKELTAGDCKATDEEEKAAKDAESAKVIEPEKKDDAAKAADSAIVLAGIRTMKPIVAAIADPAERKRATDALAVAFRLQIGAKTMATDKGAASYADLSKGKKAEDKSTGPTYSDMLAESRSKKLGKK